MARRFGGRGRIRYLFVSHFLKLTRFYTDYFTLYSVRREIFLLEDLKVQYASKRKWQTLNLVFLRRDAALLTHNHSWDKDKISALRIKTGRSSEDGFLYFRTLYAAAYH